MSLASELSGNDALIRIQSRVSNYWDRQWYKRLFSSLGGLYSNVANIGSQGVNQTLGRRLRALLLAGEDPA
jgi:hypothetical protein